MLVLILADAAAATQRAADIAARSVRNAPR